MPTSVLLVRWNGGWHEYRNIIAELEFGRSEAFLSLGAVQSVQEARRLAAAELTNQFARIREQITAEHRPENLAQIPYVAYKPGDSKITAPNFNGINDEYEVNVMTVSEDDDGELSFVPTFGDNILGVAELQREIWQGDRPEWSTNSKNGQSGTPEGGP